MKMINLQRAEFKHTLKIQMRKTMQYISPF